MDNICHTLVGAALGDAGLKHRTRLGRATLMIAANVPDIDVAVFATGQSSVAFRRGLTHGVLAQALLPLVLAVLMWQIARRRPDPSAPARFWWLVLLSYLGVLSHVGLDWLNNYGIRLLTPFSGRWFYGDSVFIVDPWIWLTLGGGVWLARRWASTGPARVAIGVTLLYVVFMVAGARAARDLVRAEWLRTRGAEPRALMVGPRAVSPLARDVIVDAGDRYVTGVFRWWPQTVQFETEVPKNDRRPEVGEAMRDPDVRDFLVWSRFPQWSIAPDAEGATVTVADMRFSAVRRAIGGARFEVETRVPPAAGAGR